MLSLLLLILCASVLGMGVGLISGLIPGMHLNLVSVICVGLVVLWHFPLLPAFICVMCLAITHTIVDVVSSTYLGVPDEQSVSGLLPAQELVRSGEAHRAIATTLLGSVLSVWFALPIGLAIVAFLAFLEDMLAPVLGILLLAVIIYLFWRENDRFVSIAIFLLAGALGTVVLSLSQMQQPLLPLLGGLFGGAGLLDLIRNAVKIPAQKSIQVQIPFDIVSLCAAAVTGVAAAFLPGIGSSQAGILTARVLGNRGVESQLLVAGGINTVNMFFSIATWIMLGKARNGAVAALATLGVPSVWLGALLVICACMIAPLAGLCALGLSRRISPLFARVNYRYLAFAVLSFLIGLIFWFDTWLGALVFVCAVSLGLICQASGSPKHYLMGCLLLQVLVFFLQ